MDVLKIKYQNQLCSITALTADFNAFLSGLEEKLKLHFFQQKVQFHAFFSFPFKYDVISVFTAFSGVLLPALQPFTAKISPMTRAAATTAPAISFILILFKEIPDLLFLEFLPVGLRFFLLTAFRCSIIAFYLLSLCVSLFFRRFCF